MNIFKEVKKVLRANSKDKKFILFEEFKNSFDKFDFSDIDDLEVFDKPSYANFLDIVSPKQVKSRGFGTIDGQIALLHSIAHIEYNAIDLALDAVYRFRNLPKRFYLDWIEVADDEIRHFKMLEQLLKDRGSFYGALPVHQGLFDASNKALDLISRMALVPRYFEANGLDANMQIINNLKKIKNSTDIIEVLEVILEEEVYHVKKGDFWYKFGCSEKKITCDYFEIVNSVYPNSFKPKKTINIKDRLKAGFSEDEIYILRGINEEDKIFNR